MQEHSRRITSLVPDATVVLTGSASVAGLDANDVDLVALVDDVADAADRLRALYPPLYEAEWRDDWAAFRAVGSPHVDVVVTRVGTRRDAHHRRAWDRVRADPALQAEYRALKAEPRDYERRKAAFFDRIVALALSREEELR